jgi:hypothetical protein
MSPSASISTSPVRAIPRTRLLPISKEAIDVHFEPPQATRPPQVRMIEVEVGAA